MISSDLLLATMMLQAKGKKKQTLPHERHRPATQSVRATCSLDQGPAHHRCDRGPKRPESQLCQVQGGTQFQSR